MHGSRLIRRIIPMALVALVWAGLPAPAHAQATRGTILGTITDQTGAALPGATVTATETRTNVSHNTVDERDGQLHVPQHPGRDLQHQGRDCRGSRRSCAKASA